MEDYIAMCLKNVRPGCSECMSGMGSSPIELCDRSGWEFVERHVVQEKSISQCRLHMYVHVHGGQSSHSRSLSLSAERSDRHVSYPNN